jgi:hypothetical protein
VKLSQTSKGILAALAVVVAFAICDFAVFPLMWTVPLRMLGENIGLAMLGVIAAQGCLLSLCSSLGPGTIVYRRIVESIVGLVWISTLAAGYRTSLMLNPELRRFLTGAEVWIVLFAPSLYIGIQFPLWIVARIFHWRLAMAQQGPNHEPTRRLTLSDLLMTIAGVAVALATARTAFYIHGLYLDGWIGLGIFVLVAAGISLVSSLPATVLVLRLDWLVLGLGLLGAYALAALIATCLFATLFMGTQSDEVFEWVLLFAGFVLALTGPLCLARGFGYRLKWGREARA